MNDELHKHAVEAEDIRSPLDTVDETSSGVFGRSATACAERGKEVFEPVVNEPVRHINLLKRAKTEDLTPKSEVLRKCVCINFQKRVTVYAFP